MIAIFDEEKVNVSIKQSRSTLNRIDLLYQGHSRKLFPHQYHKINSIQYQRPTNIRKSSIHQHHINPNQHSSNPDFQDRIKFFITSIQELKDKILKHDKIEKLKRKRMQGIEIQALPYEKLLEIQLILNDEVLEERLAEKTDLHEKMKQRVKGNQVNSCLTGKYVNLLSLMDSAAILDTDSLAFRRKQLEVLVRKNHEKCHEFRLVIEKICSQTHLLKMQYEIVSKEGLSSSNLGLNSRMCEIPIPSQVFSKNKSMEDLQVEIIRIGNEFAKESSKIQEFMDKRIQDKASIINEIESMKQIIYDSHPDSQKQEGAGTFFTFAN